MLLLIVSTVVAFCVSGKHSTSPRATVSSNSRKLLFDDEFSGSALNTAKWNTCYDWYDAQYNGCTNAGNHELEWYAPSQVSIRDGNLLLTAQKQTVIGQNASNARNGTTIESYPFASGMVSTGKLSSVGSPKWSGNYGYYEMRAAVPSGAGIWPAFWLLPVNDEWPPEIDVMELLGDNPTQILMTYFWPNGGSSPAKDSTTYSGTNFSQGWHTYAIDWEPRAITWYIDGVVRKAVQGVHVPATQMQIIANLAVGGTLPGNPDNATIFPQAMKIDYIRVYNSK